jgi:hypothetical protein
MRAPTDDEMKSIPHVNLTSDQEWDPSCLDNTTVLEQSDWYPEHSEQPYYGNHPFGKIGDSSGCVLNEFMGTSIPNSNLQVNLHHTVDNYFG